MAGLNVEVSIKDSELYTVLSAVTVFLMEKADPDVRAEATKRLIEAGIIENPEWLAGEFIDERCPRCGCTLLGNKRKDKWCSNIGGPGTSPCTFGL